MSPLRPLGGAEIGLTKFSVFWCFYDTLAGRIFLLLKEKKYIYVSIGRHD
ncbi:hypothetical protein ACWF5S_29085 [Peribacillus butanolivorans]